MIEWISAVGIAIMLAVYARREFDRGYLLGLQHLREEFDRGEGDVHYLVAKLRNECAKGNKKK